MYWNVALSDADVHLSRCNNLLLELRRIISTHRGDTLFVYIYIFCVDSDVGCVTWRHTELFLRTCELCSSNSSDQVSLRWGYIFDLHQVTTAPSEHMSQNALHFIVPFGRVLLDTVSVCQTKPPIWTTDPPMLCSSGTVSA